ncbi:MAG: alpha-galactosidase, partial [Armatimonadota bacterium]
GIPISVDLNSAQEFIIAVEDAGDGITCDHADWADAQVTLQDGTVIWLDELKVISKQLQSRTRSTPPFSFTYGGVSSDMLLGNWQYAESTKKLDSKRVQHTQTYTDPKTGLEVRCVRVEYKDFPSVEWTLYLKNTGMADTPIIEDVQGLDTIFTRGKTGEFLLHHFIGSPCREDDYQPLELQMNPSAKKRITGARGRPTSEDMCYFNLELPEQQGVIIALGWPGQWSADFIRDSSTGLRIAAGQESTHLKLHPGEEIRTPLVVMQFWQDGDWVRSQNIWRKWMIAHNMPHPNGKPVPPMYGGCGGNPLPFADEEIALINGMVEDGIKFDQWIIDAGWYVNRDSWVDVGTWEVDKKRFPKGLREVGDRVHELGAEFVVWFEPERVNAGTWLAENRPEWVLGGKGGGLLNMGNPEARKWITEKVDSILVSEGIDDYRSDYNIDPLNYWQSNDTDDRIGMTENAYVQGFLAFWDELLRRHPGMYIDTCASGGRRNDLETLRRSIPLLRSDWAVLAFLKEGAIGQQCQTYGISYWIPNNGTGAPSVDAYTLRSSFAPVYRFGYDPRDPNRHRELALKMIDEIRQIEPYMLADFYPLTPYSREKNAWLAWQYNSPEKGGGTIQAFRRDDNVDSSMRLKLRGLDLDVEYDIKSLDTGKTERISGADLMNQGLLVEIDEKPGSAILVYKKVH